MTVARRRTLAALALASVLGLTGCARGCTSSRPPIHVNPSMDDQPKVRAQSASGFFRNGAAMREPVAGTVPIGGLEEDVAFFTGKTAEDRFVATAPLAVDAALLDRGRERYRIYCQPCHDARGDGRGILFQRGNVPTASLHQEKVLKYADGEIFEVISNGRGLMSGYRWAISARDRWAIIAHVRELERERLAKTSAAAGVAPPQSGPGEVSPERQSSPRAKAGK
jgi:mono/diheme cytochrome c family protein